MKTTFPQTISALTVALLCGCGGETKTEVSAAKEEGGAHHGEHAGHGVEFSAGKGLSVPQITRDMLGVKIVDVEEGKASRTIELPLRVFKSVTQDGKAVYLASGTTTTNDVIHLRAETKLDIKAADGSSAVGEVVSVENGSFASTGVPEVIVRVSANENIGVGAFLTGSAAVTSAQDVVVIPEEALLKTAEGYFVYVVNGDNLFRTKVSVGGKGNGGAEITDGLYSGDRVVLQPVMPLWMAELQAIRGGKACSDGH